MSENIQKPKQADSPLLLGAEPLSLVESLSVLRRLVVDDADGIDESVFCQQAADSLVRLGSIESSCIYLLEGRELQCVAGSSCPQDENVPSRCYSDECQKLARQCCQAEAQGDSSVNRLVEGNHCLLGIRLGYSGGKLGSIVLHCSGVGRFQAWQETLFRLCADIFSQSLLTMRLVKGLRQNLRERDLGVDRIDATLRSETLRRESAEQALLRRVENRGDDGHLDQVSGLPNRNAFSEQLNSAAIRTRDLGEESSLLVLDIDHFQVVNEVAGHTAGDQLIRTVAHLVGRNVLPGSQCARLGIDELGILLHGQDANEAVDWAHRLQSEISAMIFESGGERFAISVSIGVVHLQRDCPDAEELIRMAYSACQCAQGHKFGVRIFNENDAGMQQLHSQTRMLKRLIRAIEDNTIELYCQPILKTNDRDMDGDSIHSGEILVRMRDERGQLVSAGEMLALAERYGFSSKLDQRVLAQALEMLKTHEQAFQRFNHVAINLSAYSIGNSEFLDFLVEAVNGSCVNPKKLCFEITETAAILDVKAASRLIAVIKELGCTFALDDFGSGYASYLYLRDLDVDYLKIDGEFVRNMVTDPVNRALVQTMVDMGKILGKQLVAEFVENKATLEMLREMQVDYVQGYFIGRPKPLSECLESMNDHGPVSTQ